MTPVITGVERSFVQDSAFSQTLRHKKCYFKEAEGIKKKNLSRHVNVCCFNCLSSDFHAQSHYEHFPL